MGRTEHKAVYEALVRRHAADVYRFALRLVGTPSGAEELVQETFFQAWRSIGSLRDPDLGRSWLLTILRRHWARALRRESRGPPVGADDPDDLASPLPGPDLALLARREGVQAALDRLDPRLRESFLLVFLAGHSCREVAERLSIPLGTVLSRVHRARVALRTFLRDAPEAGRPQARTDDGEGGSETRFGGGR